MSDSVRINPAYFLLAEVERFPANNLNLARTIIRQSMGMGFAWPDADFQKPTVEWKRIVHRFPDWEAD